MDARAGGSGFSVVDLAANRAGVKLAEALLLATHATHLQSNFGSNTGEAICFLKVYGPPENITQSEFETQFMHVESHAYRALA